MATAETPLDDARSAGDDRGDSTSRGEEVEFSKDTLFHILQNQRRRYTLEYLKDVEGPVEMRDIVEQVAAWEADTTVEALSSDQRHRVYIALYQSHLPKFDELGVIEYDKSRGIVERTPLVDQFTAYLDPGVSTAEGPPRSADEPESDAPSGNPWDAYYLVASGLGIGLLGLTALNAPPFAGLSEIAAGTVVLLVFTLLTVGQVVERRLVDSER